MRVLDLFSGIGGFSLGLERAGMRTVAFCEVEPYCRAVLRKHWPGVPIYGDVRELTADRLAADGIGVDVICGGFPCQDISVAGLGAGLAGERSGLWSELSRIIGEVRPRVVIVENVAAILARGMGAVLGELAALGYDAEWHCIPAAAVGAPHRRDRAWIVAHAFGRELRNEPGWGRRASRADTAKPRDDGPKELMADTDHAEQQQRRPVARVGWGSFAGEIAHDGNFAGAGWRVEPGLGRVANGVPARMDRLRALGNAVVPQIPEIIGRAIMQSDGDAGVQA